MHDRISVNGICFPDVSLNELAGYFRELKPRRVSLLSFLVHEEGLPATKAVIDTGGYKVETITHVFLPGRHLERNEDSWQGARNTLNRTIQDAKALGAKSIYMLCGGHGSLTWEEAAECYKAAVAPCVAQAKTAGIALAVENASTLFADLHISHSLRDTVTLAEIAGVGVCLDFFSCWMEAGLRDTIKRAIPRLHLVQVCDYVYGDRSLPSRAVPGDGTIPVKRMIEWILDAGYTGTFDLELIGPRIDKEGRVAAIARAADKIGEILHSLGV